MENNNGTITQPPSKSIINDHHDNDDDNSDINNHTQDGVDDDAINTILTLTATILNKTKAATLIILGSNK